MQFFSGRENKNMAECKWGHNNCKNKGDTCSRCLLCGQYYVAPSQKTCLSLRAKRSAPDGRKGSKFEYKNHKENEALVNTRMTINSGATAREKGDEQIRGIINIMEELKTQMPDRAKGTKSFSIKRQWLDKLHMEALKENHEFWYLKFAFDEDEAVHAGGTTYVVTEQDIIMSMVATMIRDRKKAAEIDAKLDMYKKHYQAADAKVVALQAELEAIKSSLEYAKISQKVKDQFSMSK